MTALHPSGTVPGGLEWPENPQWINFVTAFNMAEMPKLLASSIFIVLSVVPATLVISTMADLPSVSCGSPFSRATLPVCVRVNTPVPGDHHPHLLSERAIGIYNTRVAITLPLIAL